MYGNIPYVIPNTAMMAAPAVNNIATASGALGKAGSLFTKINWASLLSNAQKTLNVVNQAIPLYYQVKPVFKNIKTLGKIGKEFTKINLSNPENLNASTNTKQADKNIIETAEAPSIPEPTFFL